MKQKYLFLLFGIIAAITFTCCKQKEKPAPVELMEVTGIISGYDKDVMYLEVKRTGMVHPLRMTDQTQMPIFAAPRDTVLLVYTGYLGYTLRLPEILEVKELRPYVETGSKVVNLKELQNSGELITRP